MRVSLLLTAIAALALGAAAAVVTLPETRAWLRVPAVFPTVGKATVGGPFTLVDHTGRAVTDNDFRGRYLLVFFGFTYCPDVCPSGLQVMAAALDKIGPKAERVTPLFITVDPERDTPEQLAQYVSSFHPRLVGLTGSPEQVAAAAKAYRVYFRKRKDEKVSADYTIDHTSIIYLMDPQGEFVTHFTHATSAEVMADKLASVL